MGEGEGLSSAPAPPQNLAWWDKSGTPVLEGTGGDRQIQEADLPV